MKKIIVPCLLSLAFLSINFIPKSTSASTAASVSSPYMYNFNSSGSLLEIGDSSESSSPYWWVNSGAYLNIKDGRGATVLGSLPASNPWRILYSANNPTDTDGGYHPQNIFRLVTRSLWQNSRQEAYFIIKSNNLSSSPNRNVSNGLLLFNRYQNGDNLYYTGVRVDGSAVIKKKINGTYYTMALAENIYPGIYDRNTKPNLLPLNQWIGLRSEVTNQSDGSVKVKLYLDKNWQGKWILVAEATDDGKSFGGSPIKSGGFGGIRTDFMDVQFENFRLTNI